MRVHHFTATLSPRDAVGHHTLAVDDLLREMGHDTTLFAQSIHPDLASRARDFRDRLAEEPADAVLYQASTGSPVADHLLGRPEPLVLAYHNLTPAEAFDPWEPHIGAELDAGRRQLARLARRAVAAVADSHFNANELFDFGLDDVVRRSCSPPSLIAARPCGCCSCEQDSRTSSPLWPNCGALARMLDCVSSVLRHRPATRTH